MSEATSGVLGAVEAGAPWAVELTRTAIKMTSVVKTMQPIVCAMRQRWNLQAEDEAVDGRTNGRE